RFHTERIAEVSENCDLAGRTPLSSNVEDRGEGVKDSDPSAQTSDRIASTCTCEYYNTITKQSSHFATFPEDLIKPCILAGCPAGGTVLDPFFGSGTTGLVAAKLHCRCIGVELSESYIAIAKKRLSQEVFDFQTPESKPDHAEAT